MDRDSKLIESALASQRQAGERTPLMDSTWSYVEAPCLETATREDWSLLAIQRKEYEVLERSKQVLEMLLAQKDAPSFGYQINNYQHCLQSATKAMQDGQDDETIVVALFHDLGFMVCNETHGDFAAQLLRPYVHEKHIWALERHMYFQYKHCPAIEDLDYDYRDRWADHPYFDWTANFVHQYDVQAMNASFQNAPLEDFIPRVNKVFSNPRKVDAPE